MSEKIPEDKTVEMGVKHELIGTNTGVKDWVPTASAGKIKSNGLPKLEMGGFATPKIVNSAPFWVKILFIWVLCALAWVRPKVGNHISCLGKTSRREQSQLSWLSPGEFLTEKILGTVQGLWWRIRRYWRTKQFNSKKWKRWWINMEKRFVLKT